MATRVNHELRRIERYLEALEVNRNEQALEIDALHERCAHVETQLAGRSRNLIEVEAELDRLKAELVEWHSGGLTVEGEPLDPDQSLVDTAELAALKAAWAELAEIKAGALRGLEIDRDGWRSRAEAMQARVAELEAGDNGDVRKLPLMQASDPLSSALTRAGLPNHGFRMSWHPTRPERVILEHEATDGPAR